MKKSIVQFSMLVLISAYLVSVQPAFAQIHLKRIIKQPTSITEVTLNGLKITIDKKSGSILGLFYPGTGKMLEAMPERAGIVDVAYPIPEFDPLRLASRYSTGAQIEPSDTSVIISWDNLGPSRSYFNLTGKVTTKVWITALADGRSLSMKCRIENNSERSIGQVLFPDFQGLLPFAGKEDTYLRTAGFTRRPFIDIGNTLYPEFYAVETGDIKNTAGYTGGSNFGNGDNMVGRWLDYGGLRGGISLFPKVWSTGPATKVRIFRTEKDPNVRLVHMHDSIIKPGATWESPEYILTPHRSGWAKGIEIYRNFVTSNVKREYPIPQHVREGLGFRTIWMCTGFPGDGEQDIAFKIKDLPQVAKEAKEHGLDELVMWFWHNHNTLPVPPPFPQLGTASEMTAAIKECNKIGVNVSPFLSIVSVSDPTASRYGWKVGPGWTYHPEMIPRFNPPYAFGRSTKEVTPTLPNYNMWEKDVLESVKYIYDTYSKSICWDQVYTAQENVFRKFIPWAKEGNPTATFSGEIGDGAEVSANFLDYTWNWESGSYYHNLQAPYRDIRAFNTSFPAPRMNYNINRKVEQIRYAFMDNSYLNVFLSKRDDANGTAWINEYPDISRVLKQCAGLRRQFLNYFTEGTLIGECLLKEPSHETHINSYVLPDRILLMIMNTGEKSRAVNFKVDLEPWMKSTGTKYEVRSYDQFGKYIATKISNNNLWASTTSTLGSYAIEIFEFIKK